MAAIPQRDLAALADLNPALASRIADIAGHPLTAQPPDLRHLPGGAAGRAAGAGRGGGGPGLPVPILAAALAAFATFLAVRRSVGPLLGRRRSRSHPSGAIWRRIPVGPASVPLALVLLVPLGGAALWVPLAVAGSRTAAVTAPPAGGGARLADWVTVHSGTPGTRSAPAPVARGSSADPWSGLVAIEQRLSAQHDRVVVLESTIDGLARSVGGGIARSTPLGPALTEAFATRLHQAVAAHDAAEAAYQSSLRDEYSFFRSAATNPAQRDRLLAAALQAPVPGASDAVAYDLRLIDTQLAQEAAIRDATLTQASSAISAGQVVAIGSDQATPLALPMAGSITQVFGATSLALEAPLSYLGRFYPHFHTGLDIAAPLDTPVAAAAGGVVILAGSSVDGAGHLVGYGNYVVLQHPGGLVTLYAHLDRILVARSQQVVAGQPIGQEGSTGWSTGPHLHLEVRRDGQVVDPLQYLGGAR